MSYDGLKKIHFNISSLHSSHSFTESYKKKKNEII